MSPLGRCARVTPAPLIINVDANIRVLQDIVATDVSGKARASLIRELAMRLPTTTVHALAATAAEDVRIRRELPYAAQAALQCIDMAATAGGSFALAGALVGLEGMVAGYAGLGALVAGMVATVGLVFRPSLGPARRLARHVLGLTADEKPSAAGFVDPSTGQMVVKSYGLRGSKAPVRTFAHELMHVLDIACGRNVQISSSREFTAIYKQVQASGFRHWPGVYAMATSAELFAEAACIFLGLQGSGMADAESLREDQPALYAFMDDFFRRRLPLALSRARVHQAEEFGDLAQRPTLPVKSEACVRVLEELAESDVFDAQQRARLRAMIAKADRAPMMLADVVSATTYTWLLPPMYGAAKAYVALAGAYEAVKSFVHRTGT